MSEVKEPEESHGMDHMVDDYALVLGSSMPTITIILGFLRDMARIYDASLRITDPVELYVAFLYMEKEYIDRHAHNYAESIHLLHPVIYQNDQKLPYDIPNACLMERLRCPSCSSRLRPKQAYEVHIQLLATKCRTCKEEVTLEAISIATFIYDYKKGRYEKLRNCRAKFMYSPSCNTWNKFTKYLNHVLRAEVCKVAKQRQDRQALSNEWRTSLMKMIQVARNNVSKFSIDLVPGMYKQLEFVSKICSNISYWRDDSVLETAIRRYHKFMILMREYPNKMLIPTLDIELVWRAHQTHASTYIRYTYTIHRRVVEYDDSLSRKAMVTAYAKTFIHWARYYHEPYSIEPPSFQAWLKGHYRSTILCPPLACYRLTIWMMHHKTLSYDHHHTSADFYMPFIKTKPNASNDAIGIKADAVNMDDLMIYDHMNDDSQSPDSDDNTTYRYDRSSSMDSLSSMDNPGSNSNLSSPSSLSSSRRDSIDSQSSNKSYTAYNYEDLMSSDSSMTDASAGSGSAGWISTRDAARPVFKAGVPSLTINTSYHSISSAPSPKAISTPISGSSNSSPRNLDSPSSSPSSLSSSSPSSLSPGNEMKSYDHNRDTSPSSSAQRRSSSPLRRPSPSPRTCPRPASMHSASPSPLRSSIRKSSSYHNNIDSSKSSASSSSSSSPDKSKAKAVSFFATTDVIEIPYMPPYDEHEATTPSLATTTSTTSLTASASYPVSRRADKYADAKDDDHAVDVSDLVATYNDDF